MPVSAKNELSSAIVRRCGAGFSTLCEDVVPRRRREARVVGGAGRGFRGRVLGLRWRLRGEGLRRAAERVEVEEVRVALRRTVVASRRVERILAEQVVDVEQIVF